VTTWTDVGSWADLRRSGRLIASLDGREIGVLAVDGDGSVCAVRNRCPHHGAPLGFGHLRVREASAGPGTYAVGSDVVLRCPRHGWEFDVRDGQCPDDPAMRVAVYDAEVRDGRVLVDPVPRRRTRRVGAGGGGAADRGGGPCTTS
jgi:3-phenylpropionate/trans-cinnamate dioxygenase ferredoxin subunit